MAVEMKVYKIVGPPSKPRAEYLDKVSVTGNHAQDETKRRAKRILQGQGHKVDNVSWTPDGLVAYVHVTGSG